MAGNHSIIYNRKEYIATTYAAKEALWLKSLLSQLFKINSEPTTLFSHNQSAIALTKDHQYHAHTKHIDIRFHFIQWIVENGYLQLIYSPKVKHFASELRLVSIWGGVLESGKQIRPEPSARCSCLHSKWCTYHHMYHQFHILSYFVATYPFLYFIPELSSSYCRHFIFILLCT